MQKLLLSTFILLAAPFGYAHGFGGAGWLHPLTGMDHMFAMLAVGAWSAQLGGKAIIRVPLAFVCAMLVGGLLGFEHVVLLGTEVGVALSVLILGLAIMIEGQLGVLMACLGVGLFGVYHGWVHGFEMPAEYNKVFYTVGFLVTTAGLHVVGAVAGLLVLEGPNGRLKLRAAGAKVAVVGGYLLYQILLAKP